MSIDLTSDEADLLVELLSCYLDLGQCVSIGEEITVNGLLEKLKS